MNSLEFINLEIAITNTKYKEHLKFAQFELATKDEKRLQTLHQIKAELEAWEVVKNSTIQIKETFVDKDCNDNVVVTIIFKEKDFGKFEKGIKVKDE